MENEPLLQQAQGDKPTVYLASNLKVLRAYRKHSQEDAARILDVKRSSYSGYENGGAEPKLELLVRMAKHFRVSLDALLTVDMAGMQKSTLPMFLHLQATKVVEDIPMTTEV